MLLTFGHGTATAGRMTELLRGAEVAVLVDVRTAPGSRRHPHVARAELERWLPEAGISYRWDKRLGGFRRPAPDSPDTAWREDMFRGYAAHMRTDGFLAAVDEVLTQARADATANAQFKRFLEYLGRFIIPRQSIRKSLPRIEDQRAYLKRIQNEHREILDSIRAGAPTAARAAMRTATSSKTPAEEMSARRTSSMTRPWSESR